MHPHGHGAPSHTDGPSAGVRARWSALAGITPVIVTPFGAEEAIDPSALRAEIDFLRRHGAGSVAIGLASEVTRLTDAERIRIVELVRDSLGTEGALVSSCIADSSRAAADLATRLTDAGADVLMVTPPRAPGVSDAAVVDYFARIAEASGAALIVQDAPQETGVPIDDKTILKLAADLSAVVAVKLESPDALERMARLSGPLRERGAGMLGGSGGAAYLTEFGLGAVGTLPGPSLVDVFLEVDRRLRLGDRDAAQRLLERFDAHIGIARAGMTSFINAQKRLLAARGVDFPLALRAPSAQPDDDVLAAIDELCASLPAALPITPAPVPDATK